jgi:hypothetical protein
MWLKACKTAGSRLPLPKRAVNYGLTPPDDSQ